MRKQSNFPDCTRVQNIQATVTCEQHKPVKCRARRDLARVHKLFIDKIEHHCTETCEIPNQYTAGHHAAVHTHKHSYRLTVKRQSLETERSICQKKKNAVMLLSDFTSASLLPCVTCRHITRTHAHTRKQTQSVCQLKSKKKQLYILYYTTNKSTILEIS